MDETRALEHVDRFLAEIDLNYQLWNSGSGSARDESRDRLLGHQHFIAAIADEAAPIISARIRTRAGRGWEWRPARDAAVELRAIILNRKELKEVLGPQGPRLSVGSLHPGVWENAAPLWEGRHFREAVQRVATFVLDTLLPAKVNRFDVLGVPLLQESFSLSEPVVGKPRLRFPDIPVGSDAWRDAHVGVMSYGQGCAMAIRNLATHRLDQPDEDEALELLAALSALARWIDEAEVAQTEGRPRGEG